MEGTMAQSRNEDGQGEPFRSPGIKLTEIERIAAAGTFAKELARSAAKDVRPFGAEEVVGKGIDYLARPDLGDIAKS
jgi:hypothetical protein